MDVHYHGVEYDSNEVFDSSFLRGESVAFPLNRLIPGWQERHPGMKSAAAASSRFLRSSHTVPAGGGHQLSGKTLVFVIDLLGTQ